MAPAFCLLDQPPLRHTKTNHRLRLLAHVGEQRIDRRLLQGIDPHQERPHDLVCDRRAEETESGTDARIRRHHHALNTELLR